MMGLGLGLSAEALAQRRRYVCAGDAAAIMAGEWGRVWRAKRGLDGEDDLTGELRVQMGLLTEPFNLAWYRQRTGRAVTYYSGSPLLRAMWLGLTGENAEAEEMQVARRHPFMACNLDAMSTTAQGHHCVLDAKHVGRADDPMILRYTAAGTHQATVMGTDWWALSVFVGNGKWELIEQEVDPLFQTELIMRERDFWGYVERGEEPPEAAPELPPKPQPTRRTVVIEGGDVDAKGVWTSPRVGRCEMCNGTGNIQRITWTFDGDSDRQIPEGVDFEPCDECGGTGRTEGEFQPWPNWGGEFAAALAAVIRTQPAATVNAIAREQIKALLPEDVGEVIRGDATVKRDKSGAVRFSLPKKGEAGC